MLRIDGSHGEGGGQIVRTALSLACITALPIEIVNIRAGRSKPGLRHQHVTCLQAAADICDAEMAGDYTGSEKLVFKPGRVVRPGSYAWTVDTAGAASLVMQTVLLPLALAAGPSHVHITGGTHVPMSPSAHFIRDAYVPLLVQSGADVLVTLHKFGWYPHGGGELGATIAGSATLVGQQMMNRGELERIFGVALATNLPAHIPQRMADRLSNQLKVFDTLVDLRPQLGKGRGTGAGLFLTAEYSNGRAGIGVLGRKGMPSEEVADTAFVELRRFHESKATIDEHLADQLLLVLALAAGESQFITPKVSLHLQTNKWVIQQFVDRPIHLDPETGLVRIAG